ncbi:MAG: ATP-binding protein [Nitrospirae bacterium]|nr:ATP-binding protein [Nitrospirota bacterium]
MANPFYLQEIPVDALFCNRIEELKELQSYAEARANVVIFSPRRYGKTSLVKRIQKNLSQKGAVTIFADFFGVASVDDVAARLAKAVFAVTHKNAPLWKKALRAIKSFRPVLKPEIDGTFTLSVEPSSIGTTGVNLLDETMGSLGEFIGSNRNLLVHIALDEFQEIVVLKEALKIEAVMRTNIQQHRASYFFIGSRRRVLLGIFNEQQRPFFQSAVNYPLKSLPADELEKFIIEQFRSGKIKCSPETARRLASVVKYHPYYSQKLGFFVFEIGGRVTEDSIDRALGKLLLSEKAVFEATTQGLTSQQRLLLHAIAMEPAKKILASSYIRKHGIGSIGGIQHALRLLEELDLVEKDGQTGCWNLVDPLFAVWLRSQTEEKII